MSPNQIPLFDLSSTGSPPSHRVAMAAYRAAFAKEVENGTLRPFVLLYHMWGMLLLLVYLCIPHTKRPWLYKARWGVLAVIWWWQWRTLQATSMSMAFGYAAGLMSAWGVAWSTTWLIWSRPQFDARRVERRRVWKNINGPGSKEKKTDEVRSQGEHLRENGVPQGESSGNVNVRQRTLANGNTKHMDANGHVQEVYVAREIEETSEEWEYYWQPYPENLRERIGWVLDLLVNFRLPGWNIAIPPLPPLPPSIIRALGEPVDQPSISGVSHVGLRRIDTRHALLKQIIPRFIIGYFLLDALKVTMMKDPYYIFGPNSYALPAHLAKLSPFQLKLFRIFLNSSAIIISLEMVFMFPPIFGCLLLGPNAIGLRGEPYYYASTWGSFSNIMNKGLNGLWGGWWHQIFRFPFSAPTNYLISNGYIKGHGMEAKVSALICAFGISGFLHCGGSISQFPKTYIWHAPVFFMLQALGILIQTTFCSSLHPYIKSFPRMLRQVGNLAFAYTWLFYTSYWLVDDFSRGGIWLYEPIPVSILRGLGFGDKDDGWWCWDPIGISWYTGKHWWESGIAI